MSPKIPAILITTVLAAVAPAAAIDVPQTRAEFVKAVSEGRGATKVEKIDSARPLDRVYALLQDKVKTCLDVKVTRTANVGYVERSSSDYNPTLERASQDRAEFTLQVENNPRGVGHTPPPNGLFIMAADLRSIDGGRTEIVFYRPTIGFKTIAESLRKWFDGEPADCPKIR